ncbi:MAG: hypothetical protein KAF42_08490 [Sphingopyxis terrae]|nr:hypothetical protein [Sphingopyxis terrae]
MRMFPGLGLISSIGAALGMAASPHPMPTIIDEYLPLFRSRNSIPSHPGYRSRGKQARPRKRPNRRHISRRVRRSHRRSKAA